MILKKKKTRAPKGHKQMKDLMAGLAQVPKAELDKEIEKDAKRKKRRKRS